MKTSGKRKLCDMLKVYSNTLGLSAVLHFKQNCMALFQEQFFTAFRLCVSFFSFPHHVISCCSFPFLFSQISICFLNRSIGLLSCLRFFFVVICFSLRKKKKATFRRLFWELIPFPFWTLRENTFKAVQLPGTKHCDTAAGL